MVRCTDGAIGDDEVMRWRGAPLSAEVALRCEEVRALFEGPCLARGQALVRLDRAHFDALFPDRAHRKNACTLRRWARRIRGERARDKLARASWRQLRAAACHDDEDAQISAAIAWILGIGRDRTGVRAVKGQQDTKP